MPTMDDWDKGYAEYLKKAGAKAAPASYDEWDAGYANYLRTIPTSENYYPFATGKSNLPQAEFFGVERFDQKWLQDNSWLQQYLRRGASGSILAPSKGSTPEEYAAYQYYRVQEAEPRTQALEAQWKALQDEIAENTKYGMSADEIIKNIDWSKYGALQDYEQAVNIRDVPFLTRPFSFSSDALYGVYNAAKKGKQYGTDYDFYADRQEYEKELRAAQEAEYNAAARRATEEDYMAETYAPGGTVWQEALKSYVPGAMAAGMAGTSALQAPNTDGFRYSSPKDIPIPDSQHYGNEIKYMSWLDYAQTPEELQYAISEAAKEFPKISGYMGGGVKWHPAAATMLEDEAAQIWGKYREKAKAFGVIADADERKEAEDRLRFDEYSAYAVPKDYTTKDRQKGMVWNDTSLNIEPSARGDFGESLVSWMAPVFGGVSPSVKRSMTAEEDSRYQWLWDNVGHAEADEYLQMLSKYGLNQRTSERLQGKAAAFAKENPVEASAYTVATSIPSGAYGLYNTVAGGLGAELDPNDPLRNAGKMNQAARQAVAEGMDSTGAWFYNVGMSIADVVASRNLAGKGSLALMAGNSGAAAQNDVFARGGSSEQAAQMGAVSAALTYVTEKLDYDRFTAMLKNGSLKSGITGFLKGLGINALKSAIPEALEEGTESIGNAIADYYIMGAESNISRMYAENLTALNGNKDAAWAKTAQDFVGNLGLDALAGAVSGGVFGGAAAAINAYNGPSRRRGTEATVNTQEAMTAERPTSPVEAPVSLEDQQDAQPDTEAPASYTAQGQAVNPFTATASTEGGEVVLSGLESVGENATVRTEDGRTVPLSDAEISDPAMLTLYQASTAFKTTEEANAFLGAYEKSSSFGPEAYFTAYTKYYEAGVTGKPVSLLGKSVYSRTLSTEAQEIAYGMGTQARTELSNKAWGNYPVEAEKGYTGVVKHYTGKVSKENQIKIALADKFAKAMNKQIVVVDTLGDKNAMYAGGNTVYVAMDAVDGGITKATSHEFLHMAKESDPAAYEEMVNLVREAVGYKGAIEARIRHEIKRHADAGITLDEAGALEEIVADALPDVILTEKNIQKLEQENPKLFRRIMQWLRELVQKWRDAFKGSPEAEALRANAGLYEKALEVFERTLKGGAENATTAEGAEESGIRFSLKSTVPSDADALMQENEKLRGAVNDLKTQFKLTEGHKLNRAKVDELAGKILRDTKSKYDRATLADNLNTIFEFIANTDGINWQEIVAATTDLSKAVLMKSEQVNDEMYRANADLRKYLRTTPISLTSTQQAEVKSQFENTANYRRRLFGAVKITNNGTPLDVIWQELNEQYGDMFPADTNEGDMPAALMDVVNSLKPTVENPFGMDLDSWAADLALRMYEDYFDIPEVKTFADKKAAELAAVKARYRNRITDMRQEYKERADKRVQDVKDRHAARDAQREETRTRGGYIDQIKKTAKNLSDRLLDNTNKSNIPEAMKKAVLQTLEALNFETPKTKEVTNQKLTALREQYAMLKDKYRDMPLSGFYSEDVYDMIDSLVEITENKSIVELTTEELGIVRDVVRTIQYMVANENRLFTEGRHQTLSDAGDWTIATLDSMRQRKEWSRAFRYAQEGLQQGLLTPTMFIKQFEGTPLYDVAIKIRDGIDKHIMNVAQAEAFLRDAMEKFNYRKWDLDKQYTVETQDKKKLEMNVDEVLSVNVLWKREKIIKTRHFFEGGIILDSNRKTRTPTIVTEEDHKAIEAMLTDEQKAYADYLVNFLSTTGAEWGNEASMKLNNIRKYLEKYYFPFKVSGDYTKSSPGDVQDIRLANRGFTKKVQKGAAKPLVIRPFTQVWTEHIESMSMYNALAVPLTDFERVWNYTSKEAANASVKNSITRTFTRYANSYISTLIRDLHGGAIAPAGTGVFDWLATKSKRVAVAGNLSVYAQQPSAGIRATALIDAKYFIPGTLKGTASVRRSWNEMKKYVPTAQLKEWGYFDTNMTRTIYQRAMGKPMQKVSDAFGAPAQWGDMLNWAQIWEAVKLETRANSPELHGEDLLEAAALRVRDVLDQTQVVDSIWHRSEWQRSKGPIKIALAFMSEPIKMYNMLFDASRDIANGNARAGIRKVSAVAKGLVLNAALRALITALRDRKNEKKDKEGNIIGVRTFWDKYADAIGKGLLEAPFGLLPYIADIPSIVQGFDPGRLDASLIEKLVGAVEAVFDGKKDLKTKLLKIADPISAFSGVPITNVYRDLNAIYQTTYEAINKDALKGAAYDVELPLEVRLAAAVHNEPMDKNSGLYYDLLLYAKRYGTQTEFDMVKAEMRLQGRTDKIIDQELRERVRAVEPLIREGQGYLRDNNVSAVQRTVDALVAKGYGYEDAKKMLRSEMDYVNGKLKDLQAAEGDDKKDIYDALSERGYTKEYLDSLPVPEGAKTEGESRVTMFTYDNLATSISAGNKKDIATIMTQFKREGVPDSTIKGQITSHFKPLYYEAFKAGNVRETARIEKVLLDSVDYYKKTAKENDFKDWVKESFYSELYDLIEDGDGAGAVALRAKGLSAMGGVEKVRERIENKYKPTYKDLLKFNPEQAKKLKSALLKLGLSESRINSWAK